MLVIAVACVFGGAYLILSALSANRKLVQAQLRRAASAGAYAVETGSELDGNARERMLVPVFERMARLGLKMTPRGSIEDVRTKLRGAGMGNVSPTSFLAAKAGFAMGGVALGVVMLGGSAPGMGVFMMIGGAVGAFLLPDYLLTVRTRIRKEALVSQMPNVLDLLTVSVEAGLGFDAALAKLVERMDGPLVDECRVVLHEMRIGESRQKALRNMADRVDTPESTTLVRAIIQADQLGISLGRILRVQGEDIRHRRQMAAEERAMKAPVKMLFPTALFIFPTMFIVALGPAMLQLVKTFGGN